MKVVWVPQEPHPKKNECYTKQSLVDKFKALESNVCSDSKPKIDKWKQIFDVESNAIITTTKV